MTIGDSTIAECYISGNIHNKTIDAKSDKTYVDTKVDKTTYNGFLT